MNSESSKFGDLGNDKTRLQAVLGRLNIDGEVMEKDHGPRIDSYYVRFSMSVTLRSIERKAADIALSFRAKSCRVVPEFDRGLIRLELVRPDAEHEPISLTDLLLSDNFSARKEGLPILLGADVQGAPVVADLASMPHLLVAGTTGSGKSVFLDALIQSLLQGPESDSMRLLLIDPKRLDFMKYNGNKALLAPVLTDTDDAIMALDMLVTEMDARYSKLEAARVRSIEDYPGDDMPRIVCVIDEFADLMGTGKKHVERSVQRVAQKARACGIHLVIATQRPSVQVITGAIKANVPARVAFRVASKTDSRVILDMNGAESLGSAGDGLVDIGKGGIKRFHGAI